MARLDSIRRRARGNLSPDIKRRIWRFGAEQIADIADLFWL
jgi:hypothetical protein